MGYRGGTNGDPLPTKIFNVVEDVVICHWLTVLEAMEAGAEGFGALVQDLAAYFNDDYEIVAFNQPWRMQRAFDTLTDLSDRISLRTNTQKMVRMACQI